MNIEDFWKLISLSLEVSDGNLSKQSEYLKNTLVELSIREILSFDKICTELMNKAYCADLWDAAFIIGHGCSDDGFMDFRAWLIQQGQAVYEKVLRNPEFLAEIVKDPLETQNGTIWSIAAEAYEEKTGQDFLEIAPKNKIPQLDKVLCSSSDRYIKFPRLAKKFRIYNSM